MSPETKARVAGEPRYRIAIAPRFAFSDPFRDRLARNSGVVLEAGNVTPRDDWKPLGAEELSELVDPVPGAEAALAPTHLGLLQLPERMRLAWWAHAERSVDPQGGSKGLEKLFSEISAFLRFKRLPLPEHVGFEVTVSRPGLASTRTGSDGNAAGLGFGDCAANGDTPAKQPIGVMNLGDEDTSVVLLELPPGALVARLAAVGEDDAQRLPPSTLVSRYFLRFPQQPCLRVRLAPGEGLWLSPFGVVHDGWTLDKRDLDVVLGIAATSAAPPASPPAGVTAAT